MNLESVLVLPIALLSEIYQREAAGEIARTADTAMRASSNGPPTVYGPSQVSKVTDDLGVIRDEGTQRNVPVQLDWRLLYVQVPYAKFLLIEIFVDPSLETFRALG